MPIKIHVDIDHLDQNEFGPIAYGVMEQMIEGGLNLRYGLETTTGAV